MKILIGILAAGITLFIIWLILKRDNPTMVALKKAEKLAESKVKKAIKHDKAVAAKHAKIAKEATKVKDTTSASHDARATKMSRLIKKKDDT